MPTIQMQDYIDKQAHARLDALESSLSRLAVSVEHLATKVDASYTNLSDKLSQYGKTDWKALLAGVSVMLGLVALGGALVVRTVESGNLQLQEKQIKQEVIHSVEMDWLAKLYDERHYHIEQRLDAIEEELIRAEKLPLY